METAKITIFGKDYFVAFPTIDQFIQIEALRMSLSSGLYGQMVSAHTRTANMALDLIDAFSAFFVLLPELKETGALPENINTLTPIQTAQLISAYKFQYFPWFDGIMRSIEAQVKEAQVKLAEAEEKLRDVEDTN